MTALDITICTPSGTFHVACNDTHLSPLEEQALQAFLALASARYTVPAVEKPAKPPAARRAPKARQHAEVVEDRGDWLKRKGA